MSARVWVFALGWALISAMITAVVVDATAEPPVDAQAVYQDGYRAGQADTYRELGIGQPGPPGSPGVPSSRYVVVPQGSDQP